MPDYLHDGDVKALLELARRLPELPVLDALAALAQLGPAVVPLAREVQNLRQRVQSDALIQDRSARILKEKDDELAGLYGKLAALEQRLATRAA